MILKMCGCDDGGGGGGVFELISGEQTEKKQREAESGRA